MCGNNDFIMYIFSPVIIVIGFIPEHLWQSMALYLVLSHSVPTYYKINL